MIDEHYQNKGSRQQIIENRYGSLFKPVFSKRIFRMSYISILKTEKSKDYTIRFTTLKAICEVLDCQMDKYVPDE
ncbi:MULTISPECIES: helix-turn-helix domain-containing protein [Priestia]